MCWYCSNDRSGPERTYRADASTMGSLSADGGDSRRRTRRHVTGWDGSRECTWRNGISSVLDKTRLRFRRTWNELEEVNDVDRLIGDGEHLHV